MLNDGANRLDLTLGDGPRTLPEQPCRNHSSNLYHDTTAANSNRHFPHSSRLGRLRGCRLGERMEKPRPHLWAVAGLFLAACAGTGVPVGEDAEPIGDVRADARNSAYVVLVGLDGFRHDYFSLHKTRHLAHIA